MEDRYDIGVDIGEGRDWCCIYGPNRPTLDDVWIDFIVRRAEENLRLYNENKKAYRSIVDAIEEKYGKLK